jgi:hypothetical protein
MKPSYWCMLFSSSVSLVMSGCLSCSWRDVLLSQDIRPDQWMGDEKVGLVLNLSHVDLCDISWLRHVPLESIDLRWTQVTDIDALRGQEKLRFVNLGSTMVKDYSPLKGMRLDSLSIDSCLVSDLSSLEGVSIEHLYMRGTLVEDLSALRLMSLRSLDVDESMVKDLSSISNCPLESLSIANTAVKDISFVRNMPLNSIVLVGSKVEDLSPLRGKNLKTIVLTRGKAYQGFEVLLPMRDVEILWDAPLLDDERIWRPEAMHSNGR